MWNIFLTSYHLSVCLRVSVCLSVSVSVSPVLSSPLYFRLSAPFLSLLLSSCASVCMRVSVCVRVCDCGRKFVKCIIWTLILLHCYGL